MQYLVYYHRCSKRRFWAAPIYSLIIIILFMLFLECGCTRTNYQDDISRVVENQNQDSSKFIITISHSIDGDLMIKMDGVVYRSLDALENHLNQNINKSISKKKGVLLVFTEKEGTDYDIVVDRIYKYASLNNIDLYVKMPLSKLPLSMNKPKIIHKRGVEQHGDKSDK